MENINIEIFNEAVLRREATWWQMELPSGKVFFGDAKTEMLGFPSSDFSVYQDFTNLLHEEDKEKAMEAMRDHLSGKKSFYETTYRIKTSDGSYLRFYDFGQITKKENENIILIGFVFKVGEDFNLEKAEAFRNLIVEGTPSVLELVSKIK
jgi:PAS domain-containing protein